MYNPEELTMEALLAFGNVTTALTLIPIFTITESTTKKVFNNVDHDLLNAVDKHGIRHSDR